mmetsp:Transcript_11187/g.26271  ORF Transcript_11187/g.26271 Transcript_11187/m.26271 type:complete len:205 (-) Transcript_11187:15-629(-)
MNSSKASESRASRIRKSSISFALAPTSSDLTGVLSDPAASASELRRPFLGLLAEAEAAEAAEAGWPQVLWEETRRLAISLRLGTLEAPGGLGPPPWLAAPPWTRLAAALSSSSFFSQSSLSSSSTVLRSTALRSNAGGAGLAGLASAGEASASSKDGGDPRLKALNESRRALFSRGLGGCGAPAETAMAPPDWPGRKIMAGGGP